MDSIQKRRGSRPKEARLAATQTQAAAMSILLLSKTRYPKSGKKRCGLDRQITSAVVLISEKESCLCLMMRVTPKARRIPNWPE